MIDHFIALWNNEEKKQMLRDSFARMQKCHDYSDILQNLLEWLSSNLNPSDCYGRIPDPKRVTSINHGDYQGTLVFIVASTGYQPNIHFSFKVGYGSCSGCDTLLSINGENGYNDALTESQINDYMSLALHLLQSAKEI